MRKQVFGVSDQVGHKPDCAATEDCFGFWKKRDCTICVAKTKALIRCAVTAQLICGFVFTYAKSRFSHNEAQIMNVFMQELITKCHVLHVSGNMASFPKADALLPIL